MPANPAAMFTRPRVHNSLTRRRESAFVMILPMAEANLLNPREALRERGGGVKRKFCSRAVAVDGVAQGTLRWVDRFHNAVTHVPDAAKTWQKTQSGPVCTMQLRLGEKGRYMPVRQREQVA